MGAQRGRDGQAVFGGEQGARQLRDWFRGPPLAVRVRRGFAADQPLPDPCGSSRPGSNSPRASTLHRRGDPRGPAQSGDESPWHQLPSGRAAHDHLPSTPLRGQGCWAGITHSLNDIVNGEADLASVPGRPTAAPMPGSTGCPITSITGCCSAIVPWCSLPDHPCSGRRGR